MNLVEGMQSSSCPENHHPYLHAPGCYNQGHADLMFRKIFGLTNFMLKWIWCGFEGSYEDFCLWEI